MFFVCVASAYRLEQRGIRLEGEKSNMLNQIQSKVAGFIACFFLLSNVYTADWPQGSNSMLMSLIILFAIGRVNDDMVMIGSPENKDSIAQW